jgi:RNA polymerase sigma factor (sigma-70 family)
VAAAPEELEVEAVRARTDALYRRHHRQVARICRALLRDPAEAEDATQQVFLSAHRALLRGTVPHEPVAWLAAIARRECWARSARAAKAGQRRELGTESVGDTAGVALRNEEVAALWLAIAELPPAQREVLLLREIRGLSYFQLGRALALSPPATRSLLARARRHVRMRLQDLHTAAGSIPLVETLARLIATGINPAAPAARVAALGLVAGGAFIAPDPLEHHVRLPIRNVATPKPHHVRGRAHAAAPSPPAVLSQHVVVPHASHDISRVSTHDLHRAAETRHGAVRSNGDGERRATRSSSDGHSDGETRATRATANVSTGSTDRRDGGGDSIESSGSGGDGGGTDGQSSDGGGSDDGGGDSGEH